jgi:hypothetical protein
MRYVHFTVLTDLNQYRIFTGSEIIRAFKDTNTVFGLVLEITVSS